MMAWYRSIFVVLVGSFELQISCHCVGGVAKQVLAHFVFTLLICML